jgi:hypothetical protein
MGLGEAFNAGDELVDARVVLHGAGAERVHAEVDGVVPGGEAREVADDFDLAQLRELRTLDPLRFAQECADVDFRHVERRQLVGAFAGRGFLEDQAFVLGLVGADFPGGDARGRAGLLLDFDLSCHGFFLKLRLLRRPRRLQRLQSVRGC